MQRTLKTGRHLKAPAQGGPGGCPARVLQRLILVASILMLTWPAGAAASDTQPLGGLGTGSRVVDNTWQWQFRTGEDYSHQPGDKTGPVTWIVVARDHYGPGSGVTLLSEELIGRHWFDNSSDRQSQFGSNHWGNSGTTDATRGLRPWLNSTGIHSGQGFYHAFSNSFKRAVLTTDLPNREWKEGQPYTTRDKVFIPSTTELGDTTHRWTYAIGTVFAFFTGVGDPARISKLGGENWHYWTRSPIKGDYTVHSIYDNGGFYGAGVISGNLVAVRPALNLSAQTPVSLAADTNGAYVISGTLPAQAGDVNGDGQVDVRDVVLVIRHTLELEILSENQLTAADVNGDGQVNVLDATLIMRCVLGLIDRF